MQSHLAAIALATAMVSSSTVYGADLDGRFAVKGAGSVSCGELTSALDGNAQRGLLLYGWVEGYLTAANQYVDGVFDHAPWQRVELLSELLLSHCTSNAEQPVFRAMELMLEAMEPSRLTQQSPIETIDAGNGQTFDIFRATLRSAQQRLVETGHLDGGADGKFGPKTAAAIAAFQQAAGLQVNSLPDQPTLLALFAESFNAR